MQENVENFTKIIDRLKYFLDCQGYNFNQLAIKIGVSNSYFSKMYKNKGSLGEDIIQKIVFYYEDISPDWLLTGRGSMLLEHQPDEEYKQKYYEALEENRCLNKKLISALEKTFSLQDIIYNCKDDMVEKNILAKKAYDVRTALIN
ncbi:MAG: helix-turn-helix domain-containing protein [Prevotellaceae bacterium]|jgi:transcriptional regulator with XRE-family HTH domain|nr:helix-turn-helix domain-containing protein [Prevotellaceae bacterium]